MRLTSESDLSKSLVSSNNEMEVELQDKNNDPFRFNVKKLKMQESITSMASVSKSLASSVSGTDVLRIRDLKSLDSFKIGNR